MIISLRNNSFYDTIIIHFPFITCTYNSIQKKNCIGFYFYDYEVIIEIMIMIMTVLINIVINIYYIVVIPVIMLIIW